MSDDKAVQALFSLPTRTDIGSGASPGPFIHNPNWPGYKSTGYNAIFDMLDKYPDASKQPYQLYTPNLDPDTRHVPNQRYGPDWVQTANILTGN